MLKMMKAVFQCCFGSGDGEIVREDSVPAAKALVQTPVPLPRAPMLIKPLPPLLPSPCALEAREALPPSSATAVEGTLPSAPRASANSEVEDILGGSSSPLPTIIETGVEKLHVSCKQRCADL